MLETAYLLAAVDMDGTLLNTDHVTTPYTRNVVARAHASGRVVALCSGRAMSELTEHLALMPSLRYVIYANGATVVDTKENRCLASAPVPRETALKAIELVEPFECIVQLFIDGQSYVSLDWTDSLAPYGLEYFRSVWKTGAIWDRDLVKHFRENGGMCEKMNMYFTSMEDQKKYRDAVAPLGLAPADSIAMGLELTDPRATKDHGLESLCAALNIPIEQAIAIGDSDNDADMLRVAGLSVAMKNAREDIRAIADVVTEYDNDHDGAARAIQKYMLGE